MGVIRHKHFLAILISIILFFIPFFWIKPGEMDLGGDSSRLYFYDPSSYLTYDGLLMTDSAIEGMRTIEPHFYNIPYVFMISLAKSLISSSYVLISSASGLKLSVSFLSVYLIVYTIIKNSYKEEKQRLLSIPAILGGFFYIFMPIMTGNYGQAILAHNQVFLNPLLFYLFLVYFLKQKFRYLTAAIIISVLFAPNFAWTSAPPVFAFFPIAFIFLIIYVVVILKLKIYLRHIVTAIFLLLGLHAFHLIPEIYDLFNSGSYVNTRVFDKNNIIQQLNYFYGVLPLAKLSSNIFAYDVAKLFRETVIVAPFIILTGFILNKKNKTYALTGIFLLITLYLVTANITMVGVKFYEILFHIPGFSMFRNFIGQWAYIYSFFYALLFGQALYMIMRRLSTRYFSLIGITIGIVLIISSWKFINGEIVNKPLFHSNPNLKTAMKIDPKYEQFLKHIRSMKDDYGSIISFPFSDCCYSSLRSESNYAYIGLSPITFLGGKKDYNGYLIISPFGEVFLRLAKEKDYESIKKLFALLHIRYIFHNSDQGIYDKTFPSHTYSTVKQYLPQTQKEYEVFIHAITSKKIYEDGTYNLYELKNNYILPHFYIPNTLKPYDNNRNDWYGKNLSFFVGDTATLSAYMEREVCSANIKIGKKCNKDFVFSKQTPTLSFEKINSVKYLVHVQNANDPYLLVFSETYHPRWNIYLVPEDKYKNSAIKDMFHLKQIADENQILVNGYANGWHISPRDVDNKQAYTIVVEMTDQRVFYISLLISCFSLVLFIFVLIFRYRNK